MKVVEQIDQLEKLIGEFKGMKRNPLIGFVPTMGALHEGHLSLIREAKKDSDLVVCSIFVNPTQFSNSNDLQKYPRTVEEDIGKLIETKCDLLFLPSEEEIYPNGPRSGQIDLGGLDLVMEGVYRADHFQGVAMVVERLFEIVQPDKAFFGLKDFQQVAIIKHLIKERGLLVEIVPVSIVRNRAGLALSSRNKLLSDQQLKDALIIYNTLVFGKELCSTEDSPETLRVKMIRHFNFGKLRLEYLEIVDPKTLQPANKFGRGVTCCMAAYCKDVRLIDNLQLM